MRVALISAGVVSNIAEFDTLQRATDLYPALLAVDVTALDCGPQWTYNGVSFAPPPPGPVGTSCQGWRTPLYMSQGDKVIQNTTVKTSSGASQSRGSALLKAGEIDPSRLFEFKQFGVVSTGPSGVTLTVRLELAGGVVISLPLALPANMSNVYWELQGKILGRTKGVAGSLVACLTLNGPGNASITPAPVTVNTTIDNQLDLTYQWSAAHPNNSLVVLGTFLEATT